MQTPFVDITKNTETINHNTKKMTKATDYFFNYIQGTYLVKCFQIKVGITTIDVIARTDKTSKPVDLPSIPNI